MLVLLLAASLVLGSSLLAAASYREGALLAPNTPARKAAVAIAFSTGLAVLCLAYFESPASVPVAAVMPAASAEPAPTQQLKVISLQPKVIPAALAAKAPVNSCAALTGVESLQCLRCSETSGLRWIVCQERVRLAYCEHSEANEATCPSPIPASPPV